MTIVISADDVWLYAACNAPIRDETAEVHWNGDNQIQYFHLGRYIVGYTFGNHLQLKTVTPLSGEFILA